MSSLVLSRRALFVILSVEIYVYHARQVIMATTTTVTTMMAKTTSSKFTRQQQKQKRTMRSLASGGALISPSKRKQHVIFMNASEVAESAVATEEFYEVTLPKPIDVKFARGNDGGAYALCAMCFTAHAHLTAAPELARAHGITYLIHKHAPSVFVRGGDDDQMMLDEALDKLRREENYSILTTSDQMTSLLDRQKMLTTYMSFCRIWK